MGQPGRALRPPSAVLQAHLQGQRDKRGRVADGHEADQAAEGGQVGRRRLVAQGIDAGRQRRGQRQRQGRKTVLAPRGGGQQQQPGNADPHRAPGRHAQGFAEKQHAPQADQQRRTARDGINQRHRRVYIGTVERKEVKRVGAGRPQQENQQFPAPERFARQRDKSPQAERRAMQRQRPPQHLGLGALLPNEQVPRHMHRHRAGNGQIRRFGHRAYSVKISWGS